MKLKCKYNLYTCSNLIKNFHCLELCNNCNEGDNFQDKDDFKTILIK